ncbi:pectin lyase-like protein [Rhizodiscina lignyota]|uniref:Pectin lyase-like protein n=1 Tax=Rhizodiscina lignyota TaxID=1504668 RepID=A0A9P4M3C4_9PEZI|nr:pectin lyase-like protein [Rhizodiscina lignyota]
MYISRVVALAVAACGSVALALPKNGTSKPHPHLEHHRVNATALLYPPYHFTPVNATFKPSSKGLPASAKNHTIHPQSPTKEPKNSTASSNNSTLHFNNFLEEASCTPLAPTNPGTFWYESIDHNGLAPFIEGSGYTVFRNVKDFGAKGDGSTDDSIAIQNAINAGSSQNSRDSGAFGSTGSPAVIYFPQGKYVLQKPIQMYINTFIIGDPNNRPQIQAGSSFSGSTLVFGKDPNLGSSTDCFYSGIKNIIFVSTAISASTTFTLLDWSVSQATQLLNCKFDMPDSSQHTGIAMPEGGSGTMIGNLQFVGGKIGINMSNQQYLLKDITFDGCNVGIFISHVSCFSELMNHSATSGGAGNVGSVAIIDCSVTTTGTFLNTKQESSGDDSIVIENLSADNSVPVTVSAGGNTILTGGVSETWVYGNAYVPGGPITGAHQTGTTYSSSRSQTLLNGGKYITLTPPNYNEYSLDQIVNIKSVSGLPVMGDGQTDDTNNINQILAQSAGCSVVYFPAGTYIVTDTIKIPPGSRIIGEALSAISASGDTFKDANNPVPMVQLGQSGDQGVGQISDMLFTVADVLPGCILLEINMKGAALGDVGIYNSHFRIGGALGSTVETSCQSTTSPCLADFLLLHLTPTSSAYVENMWGWVADHDLDGSLGFARIAGGRGALIESTVGTWMIGTAFEHSTLYQYNINSAQNVFISMQQSETPYWQGNGSPDLAPAPWVANTVTYHDPDFSACAGNDALCRMAWFERISGGSDIFIWGPGFWTFFNHESQTCSGQDGTCQDNAIEVVSNPERLFMYNINTKSNLNVLINNGQTLVTQNNNPGSWGAVVAAFLADSGSSTSTNPPPPPPTGPSGPQVTNSEAFSTGAGNTDNANINDGTGNGGTDTYKCYSGGWQNYPPSSEWIEFDAMWNYSIAAMQSGCSDIGINPDDTNEQIGEIYNAIQQVAQNSLVDHRYILATIMQESIGCVWVGTSFDQDGGANPGLMQSAGGVSYDPSNSQSSITQMVVDGTQGTSQGDGLVQAINIYGNIYEAARYYNSGEVDESDLNNGEGATNTYVTDVANRMTGWVYAAPANC